MKRNLYKSLWEWKKSKNRKPIVLQGARQVGKTYLLKSFAFQEYANFVYLNFEQDPKLKDLFADTLEPKVILENIKIYLNQEIQPQKTLLILDEIQESPEALNSLKYFQEQAPEYHVAAAGSLLGVMLANSKGFPVGKVNFLDLYPMCFFEFLEALDEIKLREFLEQINFKEQIPGAIHAKLNELLRKYMFVGGMPEAVADYIKNNDLKSVRRIQNEILDAYALDFAKHAPKSELMKITKVWESIPSQLAKENKKFIFAALNKSARGREYEGALQWLAEAGLIYKSYNISTPKLPLSGYTDQNAFKVFLLDVGLLSAMSHIPEKLVIDDDKLFSEFKGAFTENFVAQELVEAGLKLYYWTSAGTAEVDFIIEKELELFPLEVKSGTSQKKKSLIVYAEKYKPKKLFRASLMNLKHDGDVYNLPLYLVGRVADFADLK